MYLYNLIVSNKYISTPLNCTVDCFLYCSTGIVEADSAFEDETKPEWVKKLRKYQLELAEPGLRGVNYIITAPTGSGKTHVASYVIYEHLRKYGYFLLN